MSLQQVSGGPSPAAIAETRSNAKAANGVSFKYATTSEYTGQKSNEFPIVPFAPDQYDDIANVKTAFQAGAPAGAGGANWVIPFTDQDAEYIRRQRDQVENADFDRWVMQKFNLEDPAQLFLFQQIAPDQFQRRMDLIDYQQNLVSRYAKMRLLGPRTMDDLKFEWLIETGRIELPNGKIWDPKSWMEAQLGAGDDAAKEKSRKGRYMKGLWSPLNYLTETTVGEKANSNRSDIKGSGTVMPGQLYTGSNFDTAPMKRYGNNPIIDSTAAAYAADTVGAKFA